MKKAIGDNMFPPGTRFEDGVALVKKAGFDGIELWLGAQPWFQQTTADRDLRDLYRKVRDAGLEVSNVSNTLDWDQNVSSRDPNKRAAALRHVTRQIEAAQIFETDAILVVAGLVTEDNPYNEVYGRTVDSLKALSEKAAQARVRIGAENCNAEQRFLLSPREFGQFLNDIGSPSVGIHFDTGNVHETGFPEQWIEMLGNRITRVHVKDVYRHRGRSGKDSVYTNLFLGDLNWPAIRNALQKVRYDRWIIAEMEGRYRYAWDQQFYDTSAAMDRLISGKL